MKITWTKVLVAVVTILLGIVTYFLKGQFDKIDVIYRSSLTLPDDVKKIKETELPKISKRLDDQQSVLVALVSAAGHSVTPEFKGLLENLLKSLIKAEFEKTNTAIATLQASQSTVNQGVARLAENETSLNQRIARLASELNDLSKTVALPPLKAEIVAVNSELKKLSELIDRQQKVAVVSWIAPFIPKERLGGTKVGEVIDLGGGYPISFVVKSPGKLSEITKDITDTYRALGLEAIPAKFPRK